MTCSPSLRLAILAREASRDVAEGSLLGFMRQGWHVLEPETPFRNNWHIRLICEYLETVSLGKIKRLILNVPPRHSKSLTTAVFWPVWDWLRAPSKPWMFTSHDADLATEHSVKRRTLIESPWFQQRWGDRFRLATDQNVKSHFSNDRRGAMYSASLSALTGWGADTCVVDDPHNLKNQDNTDAILRDVENYRRTVPSRLNDQERGAIVIIGHRLHMQDLTAWLLANQRGWTHVSLPAEAESEEKIAAPSGWHVTRRIGEPLHAERFGREYLAEQRVAYGTRRYEGVYQQRPSPLGGTIIKYSWIRYFKEWPAELDEEIQSWDFSFKDKVDSDPVAGHVWGRKGATRYLMGRIFRRMDFVESCAALKQMTVMYPHAARKLYEDAANGPAIKSALQSELTGLIPVVSKDSKAARLAACEPEFEAGNVLFPDPSLAPWVTDVITSICGFGSTGNDHDADAASQALKYFREHGCASSQAIYILGQPRNWAEPGMPVGEPIFRGLFSKIL
jgi:predicted phage terminase large subunit-like protein